MGTKWLIDDTGKLAREDGTDLVGQEVSRFFYEMATDNTWFGSTAETYTTRANEFWTHDLSPLQQLNLSLPYTELETRFYAQYHTRTTGADAFVRLWNVTDGVQTVELTYNDGGLTVDERYARREISVPITIDLSKTYQVEYKKAGGIGLTGVYIARAGLIFIHRVV